MIGHPPERFPARPTTGGHRSAACHRADAVLHSRDNESKIYDQDRHPKAMPPGEAAQMTSAPQWVARTHFMRAHDIRQGGEHLQNICFGFPQS
jgi:hypothetical protein